MSLPLSASLVPSVSLASTIGISSSNTASLPSRFLLPLKFMLSICTKKEMVASAHLYDGNLLGTDLIGSIGDGLKGGYWCIWGMQDADWLLSLFVSLAAFFAKSEESI